MNMNKQRKIKIILFVFQNSRVFRLIASTLYQVLYLSVKTVEECGRKGLSFFDELVTFRNSQGQWQWLGLLLLEISLSIKNLLEESGSNIPYESSCHVRKV